MSRNCKSLFLGLVIFLFVGQIRTASAMIPLPSMDIPSIVENVKINIEMVKSYYAKVQKVQNAIKKIQNGGFAEGAGDLLFMYESGEFDNIGADFSRFSENTRTSFMSKKQLEKRAKKQAEKEAKEKEKLMKEAEEKGITYEELMIEKEREEAEKKAKRNALKRKMIAGGKGALNVASGNYEAAFGNIDEASGGKMTGYLTGSRQEQAKDKDGNLLFDENGNPIMEEKRSWLQSGYQGYKKDEDLYNSVLQTGSAVYDSAKEGGSLVDMGKRVAGDENVKSALKNTASEYKGSSVEQSVNTWHKKRQEKKKEKEKESKQQQGEGTQPDTSDKSSSPEDNAGWGGVQ